MVGEELAQGALMAKEVSRRANSVKNDDPSVLGPPEREPFDLAIARSG